METWSDIGPFKKEKLFAALQDYTDRQHNHITWFLLHGSVTRATQNNFWVTEG